MPITIVPEQGTGPVPAAVLPTPVVGFATRRKFRLAALVRRNRRRATWIRLEHTGELPPLAMLTMFVGAVTLATMLSAWVVSF